MVTRDDTDKARRHRLHPSARDDRVAAERAPDTPQTRAASYRLAYQDSEFLLRDELRPVRLQLELLKPELALNEAQIDEAIVVFGSTRSPAPEDIRARDHPETAADYETARRFAKLVAEDSKDNGLQFVIVTGGGPGIMEAANRGAHEAGAKSVGFNIVLPQEQMPNPYITPDLSFQFHYFAIRKMHLLMRAAALVCFPGGYGTLDELFETLTLLQTGKIGPLPVLLVRRAWWDRIINFQALADEGFIEPTDLDSFCYVESAEEAWRVIRDFYGRNLAV